MYKKPIAANLCSLKVIHLQHGFHIDTQILKMEMYKKPIEATARPHPARHLLSSQVQGTHGGHSAGAAHRPAVPLRVDGVQKLHRPRGAPRAVRGRSEQALEK